MLWTLITNDYCEIQVKILWICFKYDVPRATSLPNIGVPCLTKSGYKNKH